MTRKATKKKKRSAKRKTKSREWHREDLGSAMTPGDRFAYAVLQPFSQQSKGAKIPDSNTVPSVAFATTDIFSPTIAADNDLVCVAFNAHPNSVAIAAPKNAGNTAWVWPAAFGGVNSSGELSSIQAGYELLRPAGHGVRICSSKSQDTASGFVHIAIAYESYRGATSWPYPTDISGLQNYPNYKRITLSSLTANPMIIINKYLDDTAFRYVDASLAPYDNAVRTDFHTGSGWGTILIALESCPIGAISCEIVTHLELIPNSASSIKGTAAAQPNSSRMETLSTVTSEAPFVGVDTGSGIVAAVGNRIRDRVFNAAMDAADELGDRAVDAAISLAGRGFSRLFSGGRSESDPNRLALN